MPVFERTVTYQVTGLEGIEGIEWNNNMYFFGGWNGTTYDGSTHFSSDGLNVVNCNQDNDATSFTRRAYHKAVVHENKIYLTGGFNGTAFNDCWVYDGIWHKVCDNIGGARYGHAMYSFNNKLWIVGGFNNATLLNDCWVSSEGTHWDRVVTGYNLLSRYFSGFCVYDKRMWLIGGFDGTAAIRDCYSSVDGFTWERQSVPPDFPAVCGHTVTVFDNKMVLLGGGTAWSQRTLAGVTAKLWYSFTGQEWINGADDLEIARGLHFAFAWTHKQRLMAGCGVDAAAVRYADLWQTRGVEFLTKAW